MKNFKYFCINKSVLENELTGLHDSRCDYVEKDTTNHHIALSPINSLSAGSINGWEKAADKLSHHVHYGQSELCIRS